MRVHGVSTTSTSSYPVDTSYVLLPATNETTYRTPLSRPNAVITLVRALGDRKSGRGGVLSMAGTRPHHSAGSVQSLVDGVLLTLLGIVVVVVVAAVSLARRRRRAVAASRDDYDLDYDDDDCVELAEFVSEMDDWSHDDTTRHKANSSPDDDREDGAGQFIGDVTSLTPLCECSPSSAASSATDGGSTPSDTRLYWQ